MKRSTKVCVIAAAIICAPFATAAKGAVEGALGALIIGNEAFWPLTGPSAVTAINGKPQYFLAFQALFAVGGAAIGVMGGFSSGCRHLPSFIKSVVREPTGGGKCGRVRALIKDHLIPVF